MKNRRKWLSLTGLLAVVMVFSLVAGSALAETTDVDTPETTVEGADEDVRVCPVTGEPGPGPNARPNGYGGREDTGVRQRIQDEACLTDPELAEARKAEAEVRRAENRAAREERIANGEAGEGYRYGQGGQGGRGRGQMGGQQP